MSVMLYGFREREVLLDIFEEITGLRMNHAYIRIGGVIMDLPDEGSTKIERFLVVMPPRIDEYETTARREPDLARAQRRGRAAAGRATPSHWA